ncbi:uncharacterized protein LOC103724343 isoform X2 [Phoenix dactylifera]|uniref:Uncharacterized protein LOC103724343 isoform X2 n=1 Tax=Phoenix dactylifera TaxID=42345 RepID=A0A8B8ZGB9_PHODC|nr:uncharacterized protein LOC103724343 isoform X2 [Phoenix dactylifera]
MADRGVVVVKTIWMKQAEEAKLKSEAEKAAAAKAAFEATFKDVEKPKEKDDSSDSDGDEGENLASKPLGPVDPSKCSAAGAGIAGGTACSPSTFTVVTKDSDGRKIPSGGAHLKVKISPGVGVGGSDQEGIVKDQGDGTYTVTYVVPKRGNYMVHVECDGKPIMGSPFPVFFSTSTTVGTTGMPAAASPFPNMVNQTMPNMPNYSGAVSGAFPGLLGMIPGVIPGASGGVVLQGMGASLGEICREYLYGQCTKTDCKFNHPPQNLLMSALAATTTMGTLSQAPMAPSAAAMAAAQAIVAAKALQAHAAQMQAQSSGDTPGSPDKAAKADVLKKTLQVSNLSPLLTVDQLKQLFGYCGTVVDCTITDSKHFAYIEYSKPEEATAALALNNMDVGGRPLNVEMAKSLPSKSALVNPSLPLMMQQAVAMQQMQFQQALLMQQTIASQQAAARAATMKSATEMASARAAEISKKLKAEGVGDEDKVVNRKSRSPSSSRQRSKSRSKSPIKYRRSRRSRSFSPIKYSRDRRSRSPIRSHHSNHGTERSYRDDRDSYSRSGRQERSRDHYSSHSRRHRSRSSSPRLKKSSRASSTSPKNHRESLSPRTKKSSRAGSRSPRHHRGSRTSPVRDHRSSRHSRHSRSRSAEKRHHYEKEDTKKSERRKEDGKRSDGRNTSSKDAKDSREPKEVKPDYSAVSHKRGSLVNVDEALKNEKGIGKHKKSKLDDESSEKTDDQNLIVDDFKMSEDKRFSSTTSKSHRSSTNDDNNHAENQDFSRHEKSGTSYKKHGRSESASRERGSATGESKQLRDDRASHHSSLRSHRSSRQSGEKSSKDKLDKHKLEKPKDHHEKPREKYDVIKQSETADRRPENINDSPEVKPYSTDGRVQKESENPKVDKMFERDNRHLESSDSMDTKQDHIGCCFDGLNKDCNVDNLKTLKTSPASEEHAKLIIGTKDNSEMKNLEMESGKMETYDSVENKRHHRPDAADMMIKYQDDNGSRRDGPSTYISVLSTRSMSPENSNVGSNKFADFTNQEYIKHDSADTEENLLPKVVPEHKFVDSESEGSRKNEIAGYFSKFVAHESSVVQGSCLVDGAYADDIPESLTKMTVNSPSLDDSTNSTSQS